jgi:hypothetical protein
MTAVTTTTAAAAAASKAAAVPFSTSFGLLDSQYTPEEEEDEGEDSGQVPLQQQGAVGGGGGGFVSGMIQAAGRFLGMGAAGVPDAVPAALAPSILSLAPAVPSLAPAVPSLAPAIRSLAPAIPSLAPAVPAAPNAVPAAVDNESPFLGEEDEAVPEYAASQKKERAEKIQWSRLRVAAASTPNAGASAGASAPVADAATATTAAAAVTGGNVAASSSALASADPRGRNSSRPSDHNQQGQPSGSAGGLSLSGRRQLSAAKIGDGSGGGSGGDGRTPASPSFPLYPGMTLTAAVEVAAGTAANAPDQPAVWRASVHVHYPKHITFTLNPIF